MSITRPIETPLQAPRDRPGLPVRMRVPRSVGLALGGVCVAGGLVQQGAHGWLWVLLAFNALVWPQLAYRLASRAAQPTQAEERNLLVDAAMGGFWAAAMGLNLLPSVLIVTMLAMNNLAVGGLRLFAHGVLLQCVTLGLGLVLLLPHFELQSNLNTMLGCLPFLVVYPLTIGWMNHRLSAGLSRKRDELVASERLYRATLEAMDAGVVLFGPDDRMVLCNAEFRELYAPLAHLLVPGMTFETLMREAISRGMVYEALGQEDEWLAERLRRHRRPGAPINRRFPGGRWRRIVEQRLPDGSLLAFSTDITEMMQKRQALEEAQREAEQARLRLQDALDVLPDGFALYDADDRLVIFNRKYQEVYAASGADIRPGRRFEDLLREGLARGQYVDAIGHEEEWLRHRMQQHRNPSGAVMQQIPGNRWLSINESRTREGGYAGVRVEVTEFVRREQELARLHQEVDLYAQKLREANVTLERLSDTDGLTGLANRRLFDRRLEQEWQRARRHGTSLALLMIDVDYFKRLNDAAGHLVGDECLRAVAQALAGCALRSSDLAARYGGEEFALLLPHTSREEAHALARRCLAAVDALALTHPDSPLAPHITVSIGLGITATRQDWREDARSLVQRADQALYRAKSLGRHRCEELPPAQEQPEGAVGIV